jgi:hypothetical protein
MSTERSVCVNCDRSDIYARGLCHKCYRYLRRRGGLLHYPRKNKGALPPPVLKPCSVEGCTRLQRPKSRKLLCAMHTMRLRLHGSFDPPPRARKLDQNKANRIRRLASRGGYTHHALAEAFGCSRPLVSMIINDKIWPRPTRVRRKKAIVPQRCSVVGCNEPVYCKNWCKPHYTLARKYGGDPLGHPPSRKMLEVERLILSKQGLAALLR